MQLFPELTDTESQLAFFPFFLPPERDYFESCVIPTFDLDISIPLICIMNHTALGSMGNKKIQSTVFSTQPFPENRKDPRL